MSKEEFEELLNKDSKNKFEVVDFWVNEKQYHDLPAIKKLTEEGATKEEIIYIPMKKVYGMGCIYKVGGGGETTTSVPIRQENEAIAAIKLINLIMANTNFL